MRKNRLFPPNDNQCNNTTCLLFLEYETRGYGEQCGAIFIAHMLTLVLPDSFVGAKNLMEVG